MFNRWKACGLRPSIGIISEMEFKLNKYNWIGIWLKFIPYNIWDEGESGASCPNEDNGLNLFTK